MHIIKMIKVALCIFLTVTYMGFYPKSAYGDTVQTDVVLVLDVSSSVEGEPLEAIKKGATKFCTQFNGRVAIVLVGSSAKLLMNFSSDKSRLLQAIEGMPSGGGTNPEDGLRLARALFIDYGSPNTNYVTIVMGDGVASMGERYDEEDAKYKRADYDLPIEKHYAAYTSAAYNTAVGITNCEIATVYFLPNVDNRTEDYIRLGQNFMKDIATLGCILAPDLDSLSLISSSLAEAFNSNRIDIARDTVSTLAEDVKDASSIFNIFDHEYNLPYRSSLCSDDGETQEYTMNVKWDLDDLSDATTNQYELDKIRIILCDNTYGDYDLLQQNLQTLGFGNVTSYEQDQSAAHTIKFTVASQKIMINNVEKNLIAVIANGTSGVTEWLSNFSLLFNEETTDYIGFSDPAEYMVDCIGTYQDEHNLSKSSNDNIFFMTGHSRGAAVVSLAAVNMLDTGKAIDKQTFVTTFASPKTTFNLAAEKYDCIFNIINCFDPVCKVPPYAWNYGITIGYASNYITQAVDQLKQLVYPVDLGTLGSTMYHTSDYYVELVKMYQPEIAWVGLGWFFVSIDCPVDVEVYRGGVLIAQIKNGSVDSLASDGYLVWTAGYGKRLMLPDNHEYEFVITATSEGTMDYRVDYISGDSSAVEDDILIEELDVAISTDDIFEANLGDAAASELEKVYSSSDETAPGAGSDDVLIIIMICSTALLFGIIIGTSVTRIRMKRKQY